MVAARGVLATPCDVELLRMSPNVWRVPAAADDPSPINGGVTTQLVVVRDGPRVWLVGSGPTPAFGARLACSVERTLSRPVTDVVNTRAAPELAMGNVAFDGARLHALPDVIDTMRRRCGECRERLRARLGEAGESLRADSVQTPSVAVGRRLGPFDWIALERRPGERVLVLRHRRNSIVIAQGLAWPGDVPDLRETGSAVMAASLARLHRFSQGMRVLGEQGDPATAQDVAANLGYVTALRAALASRVRSGDVTASMGIGVDLSEFASLPGYAHRHPLNVQRVYREMEAELLR